MTSNREIFYWQSNDEWWDFDENGDVYITSKAPEKAKKSFELYLDYEKKGII